MHKILIIDDDEVFCQTLADLLQAESYTVMIAKDGEEGLAKVTSEKPDLIVLDLDMPKLDGISFLKELRGDGEEAQTPVLITSNHSGLDQISEGVELGVRGYIVKSSMPLSAVVQKIAQELEK